MKNTESISGQTSPVLRTYKNGDFQVTIHEDGTLIRTGGGVPLFPTSMDCKITNYCAVGCPFCHEDSTVAGKHGRLDYPFLETLESGTELAIGGGNPLDHPGLEYFLYKLDRRGVIPNLTVNAKSLKAHPALKYVKGLGISLNNDGLAPLLPYLDNPNLVIHVIAGATPLDLVKTLYDKGLKLLILGYKNFRRGGKYLLANQHAVERCASDWYEELPRMLPRFKVVSFDNLAIDQLDVRRLFITRDWESFYMGDDGQFTMYVDLVTGKYARSSTATSRFDITNSLPDMFKHIRGLTKE